MHPSHPLHPSDLSVAAQAKLVWKQPVTTDWRNRLSQVRSSIAAACCVVARAAKDNCHLGAGAQAVASGQTQGLPTGVVG